jgi:hypothetical protein
MFILLFTVMGNVLLIGALQPLTNSDFLALLSADFLLLLVLLEVIPLEREPNMEIIDFGNAMEIHVKYQTGEFVLRLFLIGARNKHGLFAKQAKDVKINLLLMKPFSDVDVSSSLPWLESAKNDMILKGTIDPTSPDSVIEALNKTIFKKRKTDFDPSDAYMAVVGFGLSTTKEIYTATEWPVQLSVLPREKEGGLFTIPIHVSLTSPDLPIPPVSPQFIIVGKTWEDAIIKKSKVVIKETPSAFMIDYKEPEVP